MPLPRFIALCGKPGAGKSKAAEILGELFGYQLVDDGGFLRESAMRYFGATHDDVYTQEGKLRTTVINGVTMTWREVLGRLGNAYEAQFGADVIPEIAYNQIPWGNGRFIFGSVRREQGAYHKKQGALILEVENFSVAPSPFEFDRYNPANVDLTVVSEFGGRFKDPVPAALAFKHALIEALEPFERQAAE